jgi:hypothetical protein
MPVFFEGFEGNSWSNLATTGGWTASAAPSISTTGAHRSSISTVKGGVYALTRYFLTGTTTSPTFATTGRYMSFYLLSGAAPYYPSAYVTFNRSGTAQFTVGFGADGTASMRRGGSGGTLVATTTTQLPLCNSGWWIDIELLAQDAAGVCTLWVNGVQYLTYSGDTRNAGADGFDQFILGFTVSFDTAYVDDIIVHTLAEGRPGETFIGLQLPDGNDVIQSNGGAGTYTNVDENPMTSTDTNVFTTGQQDTYDVASLAWTPATIYGTKVSQWAARNGTVTQVQGVCKSGATTSLGTAVVIAASDTFRVVDTYYSTDPNTAAAWTEANLNAMKIGARFS